MSRERQRVVGFGVFFALIVGAIIGGALTSVDGAYKSSWQNSPGDLHGKSNLNVAVDDFADRFTELGLTSSNSFLDVTKVGPGSLNADVWAQNLSNATGKAYVSNLIVKAGGDVTLPADSVALASLAPGAIPADVIAQNLSNATAYVYGSNLTVKAGGTVTVPADSIALASLVAGALPADVIAQNLSNATAYVYCSNLTVVAGGTITLPASSVTVAMAADGLAAKTTITRLGAYAADDRYVFIAPVACTVRSMGYVGDTTVASDTGSNWTFTVNNKSTGLGMAATAVNSAGVADTYYSVGTITGATLVANDVLELTLGSNATPTSVGEGSFVVEWE